MSDVHCKGCGAERPAELASSPERTPCPNCGETALNISRSVADTVRAVDSALLVKLTIPVQDRDWQHRWEQVQRRLRTIFQPRQVTLSGASIQDARGELHSFYVEAYHLKDALKNLLGSVGRDPQQVERVINGDGRLALLADLANLDKHGKLNVPPRSGYVPTISETGGNVVSGGWRLSMMIQHGTRSLDGLLVAQDAVEAWKDALNMFGLLP